MDTMVAGGPGTMAPVQGITFRSDMTVELIKHAASDADVIWAARVSTKGEQSLAEIDADPARSAGLINYLMRDRHGTPFEHSSMTFYVQAPIFVFREFMRHRTFSYNEESGRYRQLDPVFYRPGPARKLVQTGKPGAYVFEDGTPEQHELVSQSDRGVVPPGLRGVPVHARGRRRAGRSPGRCCRSGCTPRCTRRATRGR